MFSNFRAAGMTSVPSPKLRNTGVTRSPKDEAATVAAHRHLIEPWPLPPQALLYRFSSIAAGEHAVHRFRLAAHNAKCWSPARAEAVPLFSAVLSTFRRWPEQRDGGGPADFMASHGWPPPNSQRAAAKRCGWCRGTPRRDLPAAGTGTCGTG